MARLVGAALCVVLRGTAAAQDASLEYQVKAAFLLNLTRFVEWPGDAVPEAKPFVVCLLSGGADPFGGALEATFAGESWRGHPFAIRRVGADDGVTGCHLLFIPATAMAGFDRLAAALPRGLLVVGESPDFLDRGGTVNLRLDHDRVDFDIDLAPADRAGLTISSQLLRLAREVRHAPAVP